jgi:site-specific DNA recombinase
MKDQYGITIWQASFSKILSNTMYYGEYRGNPDYCEPYLSKAEWLDLKRRKPIYRTQKHNSEYLFRGLLCCPVCGRNMVGRTNSHIYYVCPYHLSYHACEYSVWHRQDRIEAFLLERIKPELDAYREKPQMKLPKKDKREKQQKSLQAKLERLKNLYIDGDLSKDEYTKKRDAVRAELGKLESDHSELDYEKLNAILNSGWIAMYDRIDPEDRAHFWRTILHHIEIKPDGTYKPWFNG